MAKTEAQKKAQRKYNAKHRTQTLHTSYKSTAKNFILRYATPDELDWLSDLIDQKRHESQPND